MGIVVPSDQPDEGFLNIVRYLLGNAKYTSRRALHKLLYFTDLYHYQKYGATASGINPVRWPHGPCYPQLLEALETLDELGEVTERPQEPHDGRAYVAELIGNIDNLDLPEEVMDTLAEVIQCWGSVLPSRLLDAAKTTEPYKHAAPRQHIDFSHIPHFTSPIVAHLRHLLDLPEAETGTGPDSPDDPKYQAMLDDLDDTAPLRAQAWKSQTRPD